MKLHSKYRLFEIKAGERTCVKAKKGNENT